MAETNVVVNLYNLPDDIEADYRPAMEKVGVQIKRAMAPDKTAILDFIRTEFSQGWADEAEKALWNNPSTLYIAVADKKVVGFAAYDSTCLGCYGPLGVASTHRKMGIAQALTSACLKSMREKGYWVAVWQAGPVEYYVKHLNAKILDDHPGVYVNMI